MYSRISTMNRILRLQLLPSPFAGNYGNVTYAGNFVLRLSDRQWPQGSKVDPKRHAKSACHDKKKKKKNAFLNSLALRLDYNFEPSMIILKLSGHLVQPLLSDIES